MKDTACFQWKNIFFFKRENIPDKNEFIRLFGVNKNTFAGNMVSRIYDQYFKGATNFRVEYKKYYIKEFSSFESFIRNHFNFEEEIIENIVNDDYSFKKLNYFEGSLNFINYDKGFLDAFSKIVGGFTNEDTDGIYYE